MRQPPADTADGPQGRVAGRRPLRLVPVPRGVTRGAARGVAGGVAEELAAARSLLAATLESTTDGILVVDLDGYVVGRNTAFDLMWDLPRQLAGDVADDVLRAHVVPAIVEPDAFLAGVEDLGAHPDRSVADDLRLHDGRVLERHSAPQRTDGRVVGRVFRFRDVTAERQLRAELERRAWTDPLTGLANRTRFMTDLQAALDAPRPAGAAVGPAVCLLDLDGFTFVNDALGHRAGDRVLQAVAERLTALVPAGATLARLGGDEFGVVLPSELAAGADALCTEAVEAVSRPVTVVGGPARVGASAGWTRGRVARGDDVERLLHQADLAMDRAKKTGRGRVVAFTEDLHREDPQALRVEVEELLADAGGLVVVYQPICDLRTGRVAGFEALSRFPGREHRPPQEWFALAREVGHGDALEARAVRQALEVRLADGVYLALNLSPRALAADEVREVLDRDLTGVVVEVTEESDLATAELVAATGWLRRRGARIAMDDTGEGFAGLRRLVQLHPDVVKLDRTLVTDVHRHPDKAALVEALVAFCRRTGAHLCAEGVETVEEVWALQELQVQHCQGWMAGRPQPVPAAPLPEFVAACRGVQSVPGELGPTLRLLQAAGTTYDIGHALDEALVALEVDGVSWSQVRGDLLVTLYAFDDMPAGTYRVSDYPATRDALLTGRSCVVDVHDPDADPQEVRLLLENGYSTALLVPVAGPDGGSSSLLELFSTHPRVWDDAARALVGALVAGTAAAAQRALRPDPA